LAESVHGGIIAFYAKRGNTVLNIMHLHFIMDNANMRHGF